MLVYQSITYKKQKEIGNKGKIREERGKRKDVGRGGGKK